MKKATIFKEKQHAKYQKLYKTKCANIEMQEHIKAFLRYNYILTETLASLYLKQYTANILHGKYFIS